MVGGVRSNRESQRPSGITFINKKYTSTGPAGPAGPADDCNTHKHTSNRIWP